MPSWDGTGPQVGAVGWPLPEFVGCCTTFTITSDGASVATGGDGDPSGFGPSWRWAEAGGDDCGFIIGGGDLDFLVTPYGPDFVTTFEVITIDPGASFFIAEVTSENLNSLEAWLQSTFAIGPVNTVGELVNMGGLAEGSAYVLISLADPAETGWTATLEVCSVPE